MTFAGSLIKATRLRWQRSRPVIETVHHAVKNRDRASSAIEEFNAALRPFLYVNKGVTQGFLHLFRAYYNLRSRRWGRHKGTNSVELLTGRVVEDRLDVLGNPASYSLSLGSRPLSQDSRASGRDLDLYRWQRCGL